MNTKNKIINSILALSFIILLTPAVILTFPSIITADHSYTVISGSMQPSLKPGDLVFVKQKDPSNINLNDIITLNSTTGIFTHRVVEKRAEDGVYWFKTKGDANEEADSEWVGDSQVVGKMVFSLPLGHIYSPTGYTLSFLLPCFLLVGKQVHHLLSQFKRRSKRELRVWRRQGHPVLDTTTVLLLLILVANGSWMTAPYLKQGSLSYFHDQETTTTSLTASQWTTPIDLTIHPDTLNLESQGKWITAHMDFTSREDHTAQEVEATTILLENEIPVNRSKTQGKEVIIIKFNKTSVIEYLQNEGHTVEETVDLTVTGKFMDGAGFQGSDTVNLIREGNENV